MTSCCRSIFVVRPVNEVSAGRDGEPAVADVHVAVEVRILARSGDAHVRLQRAGHVGQLVREALHDAQIDPRRLNMDVQLVAGPPFDVARHAWRVAAQRGHGNRAAHAQLGAGTLRQLRVQHDPFAAAGAGLGRRVVRRDCQRLIRKPLEAPTRTSACPSSAGDLRSPVTRASAFNVPVNPRP